MYTHMYEFRSNFSRTHPQDAKSNNGHRKLKKTLRSNVKTKLDPFGNVVNLSDNLFSKSEFSLLNKNLNFCPRPNKYNKTSTKIFLNFTVILNLGHTLDQLKITQMSQDLKAIAIGYQINNPAVLKPS